ncbi:Fic family protein [Salinibacter ruber]|uniref:Fic family protein n=1 Tax=Salinibacter ruber TaxID=146919 RepID=A0A9X2R6Z3_9BACT|nr:Fic family protein [Salinibacter ruber]MCS3857837.1 Fic family protein [Salinibacter ruber]MCS3864664.1 Fic family protein [Salinibacter ruber]
MRSVGTLHEYRGREQLYAQQARQALDTLKEVAVIRSAESSNRIEGVEAAPGRIKKLMEESTAPETRSEQAIAGYRDVLNTIHTRHEDIEFSPGVVRQFHRDLFKYTSSRGGDWKSTGNDIIEEHPDGTEVVRFETASPHRTPEYMKTLHERFDRAWKEGEVDPLLLIAAYVLDFLCIHPFQDGNGRMARLLTLLLLYKADYGVGQYISLEKLVEDSRESYYDALYQSSQGWHEAKHDLHPWTDYFLGTLLAAYEEFEDRVGELRTQRGAKTQRILDAVEELHDGFKTRDVEELCPSVSRSLIRKVFDELKEQGKLRAEGRGPAAVWRKLEK